MSFPRYPKYKDSGVEWLGQVPAHWSLTKLKCVASFSGGRNAQPREEQMQLAEERAEIARLRQELEVERQRRQNPAAIDSNLKLQALRQHLNEIHKHEQKEREEREERKLSSRIARLWHRLDGR